MPRRWLTPKRAPVASGAAVAQALLARVSAEPAGASRPGLNAGERRAVRRRIARIAGLTATVQALAKPATAARAAQRGRARAADTTVGSKSFSETKDGVTIDASVSARLTEQQALGLDLALKVRRGGGGRSVELRISIEPGVAAGVVLCPDETGRIVMKTGSAGKLTTIIRNGGRVESADTGGAKTSVETVGQVGDDGLLKTVSSTVRQETISANRGLRVETTTTLAMSGEPGGSFTATGSPTVDVIARSPSMNAESERNASRDIAAGVARDPKTASGLADDAARPREELIRQRANWENAEQHRCATQVFDPVSIAFLAAGATTQVTGKVKANNGKLAASATWTVLRVGQGSFGGGAGGVFTATGAKADSSKDTVNAFVLAASRAGRVEGYWRAQGEDMPVEISGSTTQKSTPIGGLSQEFSVYGRWRRTSKSVAPDGTRSAEYTLTDKNVQSHRFTVSVGSCTWETTKEDPSTIEAGDFELQVAPDGTVSYGFTEDLSLGQTPVPLKSGPPGCPGSYDALIKVFVQARRAPLSSLYTAPASALSGPNLTLTETGITDSIGTLGGGSITLGWTLTGS